MKHFVPNRLQLRCSLLFQSRPSSSMLLANRLFHRPRPYHLEMSTSEDIDYNYIQHVEPLHRYELGGYHALQIDDILHNRYRIVHKLGHSSYSTVWLAMDQKVSKYVAVKVGTAYTVKKEFDNLLRLSEAAKALYKKSNASDTLPVPVVYDHFEIKGHHGTHPVMVTAPARCDLSTLRHEADVGLFQLEVGRSLAAQLTLAVCFLHSQGYCHGGLSYPIG